jgi:DNA-binding NtrC family response regulator
MVAKIEAHDDSIEAAIHSLGQSTSIFEIRGSVYERAVNRIVAAQILHKRGDSHGAAREVRAGLEVFDRLGATIDSEKARALLSELSQTSQSTPEVGPNPFTGPVVDGFVAQRLVSASISRELLLHELAAIARNYTDARAAFIAQAHKSDEDAASEVFEIGESVGLSDREQSEELRFLEALPPSQYRSSLVFPFSDDQEWHYLLHLVEPKMRGVLEGRVSLDPLVSLAEQGLERHTLRSRTRRTKPFNPARLLAEVELPGFICASRAMSRVLEQIHKIRSSDVTVLITGESGTGKELVARAIHAGSTRRLNVFVPFNCSAAPREMIESQLFGFRKGAFTGAVASNTGIIRAAEGGTIFLDEIGDLPIDLQPKLLRFLQEGEVQPIGDNQPSHVDVRVLAATNSDLEKAVAEGRFREDLFHRLNVIRLLVPPLRERREEIPAILNHYLKLYQHESSKSEIQLSEETVDLIVVYDWPGNVRQLCNEVRRIVAYADSRTMVTPEALSPEITRPDPLRVQFAAAGQRPAPVSIISQAAGITLGAAVEELERRMIAGALERSSGNIARAAKELGLSRKGLYLKMDRLNFKS